jgi:hypothetical protein
MGGRTATTFLSHISAHLPERLHCAVLINPPSIFDLLLAVLRPFIDARTMSKAPERPYGAAGKTAVDFGLRDAVREIVKGELRNVIPQDLVLLTSRLMVPRSKVTKDLLDKVAAETKELLALADDRQAFAEKWADVVGDEAPIIAGASPEESARMIDAFQTALVRNILGGVGADSAEVIYGGRQLEKASVPTARTGGVVDRAEAVRDVLLALAPKQSVTRLVDSLAKAQAKGKGLGKGVLLPPSRVTVSPTAKALRCVQLPAWCGAWAPALLTAAVGQRYTLFTGNTGVPLMRSL